MPTTAWSTMRAEIARPFGHIVSFTTTTHITTNTNVVSTGLAAIYPGDDYFNESHIFIKGGNNAGTSRRITDYTAASGTLVVAGPNLSGESGAVDCEIHEYDPVEYQLAFNRARQDLFPHICIIRDHQTIVTGQQQRRYLLPTTIRGGPIGVYMGYRDTADGLAENLVTDGGFEIWTNATTLTNWTLAGTGSSVNQEEQTTSPANYGVLEGRYSAGIPVAADTVKTLLQTVTPSVAVSGMEVNFSVWVYSNTASRVSARIVDKGTSGATTDSTAHTGTGWERLTVAANMVSDTTNFDVGVVVSSGTVLAVYADEAIATVGQSEVAEREWTPLQNWQWIGPIAGGSNGGHIEFQSSLPPGRRLRILGRDMVSSVSAESDTVEVDGELLEPLYDQTRAYMAQRMVHLPQFQAKYTLYQGKVDRAVNMGRYVKFPNPKARIPNG